MATTLIPPSPGYLIASQHTGIRNWHKRKDRSAIAQWPQPDLPAAWSQIEQIEGKRTSYAVDLMKEQRLIGRITLRDCHATSAVTFTSSSAYRIGIYLHPDMCGYGYGTEALGALCLYLFADGCTVLRLDVAAANVRAVRSYQKCRFEVVRAFQRMGVAFFEMERHAST